MITLPFARAKRLSKVGPTVFSDFVNPGECELVESDIKSKTPSSP